VIRALKGKVQIKQGTLYWIGIISNRNNQSCVDQRGANNKLKTVGIFFAVETLRFPQAHATA